MVLVTLSVVASAQASGGQIRRPAKKQSSGVTKRSATSSHPRSNREHTEQSAPTYTPPAIQPIPMSSLAKYNIVVATFSILGNAQGLCQSLRDKGWGAQIYLESSNMYRVLMVGMSDEPEAILYRDNARNTYPNAWIMCVDNGRTFKYE